MTALLGEVGGRIDRRCLVRGGLGRDGCKVNMTDAPAPRLVVDFDKPGSPLAANATRCDYLVIAEGEGAHGWVAALELKRGQLNADKVVKQLKAGASAAEKIVPWDEGVRFRPIVACRGRHKNELTKLKKKSNWISLHGHKQPVRLISCGDKLTKGLCK